MSTIYLFNKPFQVLSQFTDAEGRATLSDYINTPAIYPAGRLDYDSEGLLILTGDGQVQARIADPKHKLPKTYWAQVEGKITKEALDQLRKGVTLKDGPTRPAQAERIEEPKVWPRNPPIRHRENAPTSWIALTISEGRNRQVRRMTAEVGFPTLRLIRAKIGPWSLGDLQPGDTQKDEIHLPKQKPVRHNPKKKAGRRYSKQAK
jgi:23S rRNA pseudouridine2457 synthase